MRIAVIDLGTNTWNLVVAESRSDKSFEILWDEKIPVKLGKGGISKKIILPDAMERGMQALQVHLANLKKFKAEKVEVVATSAFRTASNGPDFVKEIWRNTGLQVNIIPGKREAELIYKGIRASVNLREDPVLILDIGGGSNELIIANRHQIFWKKSYKLGIARLLEIINPSDPIQPEEIANAFSYFENNMQDLPAILPSYSVSTLVGAAGSFETFASMLQHLDPEKYKYDQGLGFMEILPSDFDKLYEILIHSSHEDRLRMKGLESMRVEMIVLAAVFVKFVLKSCGIKHIVQSNYSLKEGLVAEIIEQG